MLLSKQNKILSLFALVFIFVVMYINKDIAGPMIQADEGSYLANAAALAGYVNDAYSSYKAGYSIVLIPAFLLGNSPEEIWFFVKLINAILLASVFIFTYLFLSEIQNKFTSIYQKLFISFIIACYPMYLTMSGYSFSENLFTPIFLLSTLLLTRALKTNGLYWLFLGISIGLLYWIHTKAIVVVIALAIVLLAYIIQTKKIKAPIQAIASLSFMFLVYKYFINSYLFEQMNISGIEPRLHYPSVANILTRLLSLDGLQNFIVRFSGHLFYITIGTLGLVWIGLLNLGLSIKNNDSQNNVLDFEKNSLLLLAFFLTLSFIGTIVVSSLMFASRQASRLDHFMYGRYVEGVIAPILAISLLSNSFKIFRSSVFVLALLLSAFVFSIGVENYTHTARFNVASFWQDFFIRDSGIGGWFFSGMALILFMSFLKNNVARIFILLFFLFCSYCQVSWHSAASVNAKTRTKEIASAVRLDNDNTDKKIFFDQHSLNEYNKIVLFTDLTFELYDFALERVSFDKWLSFEDNAPFVTFNKELCHNEEVYLLTSGWNNSFVLKKGKREVAYPILVGNKNTSVPYLLIDGWHTVEPNHVWSMDSASIKLPIPKNCENGSVFKLSFAVFNATSKNKKRVQIYRENKILFDREVLNSGLIEASVPANCQIDSLVLNIKIDKAESPASIGLSKDSRELGIALKKIDFVKGE